MLTSVRARSALFVPAGVLAVVIAGAARAADPSFVPKAVGLANATAAQVVDVNGDGIPDLAVTQADSNAISILLGNGQGGFVPGASVQVGENPVAIASADFNGDGASDLAVANDGSENVSILLGDGKGHFSAAPGSPFAAGGSPGRLKAADLNGDGRPDLAVPVFVGRKWQVSILLGDGSGRFAEASAVGKLGPYGSDTVAVGDLNGDGKPDLVVGSTESKGTSILFGNGAGGFTAAGGTLAKGSYGGSLRVADFNRDGKADLVVASFYSDGITVLLGNGTGGFRSAPGSPIVVPGYPHDVTVADFNGDGRPDLAIADKGRGTVSLLLGNGNGSFRQADFSPFVAPLLGDVTPAFGGVADFNGDGKPDLLTFSPLGLTVMLATPASPGVSAARPLSKRDAVFSVAGRLKLLAADGTRAAVTTQAKHACGRIVVWTAPGRRSTRIKPGFLGCDGDGVFDIAVGAGRVGWIEEGGGNNLEMTVMSAPLGGGSAKQIEYEINGDRAGSDPTGGWVGNILGAGSLLAYNSWTQTCDGGEDYYCGDHDPLLRVTGAQLVRITTGRRVVVTRGAAAYPLAAVGGGRMAVETVDGVSVRAANGAQIATVPGPESTARAVALSATRLAIERTFTLDLYDPASGAAVKSLPLGPAAGLQLADVTPRLALLRGPRRLVLVRLSDGKLIGFPLGRAAATLVAARLTGAGLFYAFNARGTRSPGRIVFESTARLLRRF
jgi:FG-GAP-like repeat/FG-GAP repeat